ncbi:DUF302 domain-containing protein [Halalkalibacter sp. APA_J-10(15)]|uniref:DUF302 domain-containing protein n=1 Tax=unclassified Halalkalibacter TaxID=2893063 RepID=UPI001FF34D1E|nr:DUF302 domain-containing protein [Halalkalibacter sp. APA_J-10(15)]MCK0470460.1 DUF302 domain-containing protein [Halalkalibacter sp. APA_J-10(15)]
MFDYTVESSNSFQETVEQLQKALMEEKFGVLYEFDLQAKLNEKGLQYNESYTVFEVCNSIEVKRMLEINKLSGYFLPCKITVYRDGDRIKVGMPKPSVLLRSLKNEELNAVSDEIESRLMSAIQKSI